METAGKRPSFFRFLNFLANADSAKMNKIKPFAANSA